MRICLFAEGSYPYVQGGVSSWIHNLIRALPEHEFILFVIGAEVKIRGKYKYELPANVTEVHEVFLDDIKYSDKGKLKKSAITPAQRKALYELLIGEKFSWDDIFDLFMNPPFKIASDFFMSKMFFELAKEAYKEVYPFTPFSEYMWMMRSMQLPIFYLLMQKLPKADIYHTASTGYAGILASFAKYQYDKPLIITEHGIYTREREEEIIKSKWVKPYYKDSWIKFFYSFSRCAYGYSDIVTSLFNRNKIMQMELGCPEEKMRVIPNGVRIERFEAIKDRIADEHINIGAIIRVVPIKDIKTMIQSFMLIKKEVPESVLYVMGPDAEDPEYKEECVALVKTLGIEDIIFTGMVQITDYLEKMDFMLLTSISEGQPLAVMEGLAAKKAFITTNVGDCHDLLFGFDDLYGEAGIIENVMDVNGIAKSAIKLCQDKKLRVQMGINGYNRMKHLYPQDKVVESFKNLYEQFER